MKRGAISRLAAGFLFLEGIGAIIWWGVLLAVPSARAAFSVPGAPDVALTVFLLPDLTLFAGGALLAAVGLARQRPWAWPVLCVHCGAAAYAALYSLAVPLLTGSGWLGAALMAPSLVVTPYLVWRLERMKDEG